VSCDYGFSDAAVALFWAVGPREQLVLCGEVYEKEITATKFVEMIHEKARSLGMKPDYYVADPQQPQIAVLLRERGLPIWNTDKAAMRDRAAGYTHLVDALSIDPVLLHPRLRVVSSEAPAPFGCPRTILEWKRLKRKKNTANEWSTASVIGPDHAADAARYGLQTRPMPKILEPMSEMRRYLAEVQRKNRRERTVRPRGRAIGGVPRMNEASP
jgi:hypothetical protein